MSEEVWHPPFGLAASKEFQEGIARCEFGAALTVIEDVAKPGHYVVCLESGAPIGRITPRNSVAKVLADGHVVLHAALNSIADADGNGIYPAPRVRIVTGPEGTVFDIAEALKPREHIIDLVGEQHYEIGCRIAQVGEPAKLWHEAGNPYDRDAIAVTLASKAMLGYLPRDSWIHRVLIEEGKRYTATVADLARNPRGFIDVKIAFSLTIDGEEIGEREYID